MATIQSTLALNDRMSSTLSSIVKAMHSTLSAMQSVNKGNSNLGKSFKEAQKNVNEAEKQLKQFDNQVNKTKNTMNSGSASAGSFFKALMGAQIVQKGIALINSQLDNAIQRFDILNNYKNVMGNLGISGADADKSLERMKVGLEGLPTTLQDGASAVQRFTSANHNIEASTEMFLALNNAILAGGGSVATQQAALEQLSQSYAKGKPDMMEWRTALTAMPAQLDQVAKVMGKTNATELGESLREGKTSMNEFMKTLVKMNNESVDGFKTLEAQARAATGGIQTSITNLRTAVTKGVANMLEQIDNGLKNAGIEGGISEVINNIGKTIQRGLENIGILIGQIMEIVGPIVSWIQENWAVIEPILYAVVAAITLIAIANGLWSAAQWLVNASLWACPLTWIIAGIIAIIVAIYLIVNALNEARGATDETAEGFVSAVGVIMGIMYTLFAFMMNTIIIPIYNAFAMLVNFIANCFKNPIASIKILFFDMCTQVLNNIYGLVKGIENLINMIPGVNINLTGGISKILGDIASAKAKEIQDSGYQEVIKPMEMMDYSNMYQQGYNTGSKLQSSLKKASSVSKPKISGANWQDAMKNLDNNIGGVTGKDSKGGKALKTTTDDNLFTDEDMKLLLDIATRDYKLNYQQITPNVTVSFGDVRETADVDDILDKVADKLEEIYDGNLEVS